MKKFKVVLCFALLLAAVVLLFRYVEMRISISETAEKIESVNRMIGEQKLKNSEYEDLLDPENRDDFYRNIAEDELGYGLKNEKIYRDISGN